MQAAGIPAAAAEARWLLAHVVDRPAGHLVLAPAPTASQRTAFELLLRRREGREPLQHLLGRAAFRHLDLCVGPGVFVPRPETELLIDAVLPRLAEVSASVVLDLAAGSGALGLSAAIEAQPGEVVLVERSPAALRWLRDNVAATAGTTAARLTVVEADVTRPGLSAPAGALGRWRGRVDVVLCNPPYVPAHVAVGPEVAWDPPEAVFAGPDGMQLMAAVIGVAGDLLGPDGVLALEHDETTQAAVLDLLGAEVWRAAAGHRDLAGRPRFVTAVRR